MHIVEAFENAVENKEKASKILRGLIMESAISQDKEMVNKLSNLESKIDEILKPFVE